jgi:hypothetical protein
MRSAAEIRFRLRQEAANLYLLLAQPGFSGHVDWPLRLPDGAACAAALRGSLFEFKVVATAQPILAHRFPLLGTTVEAGPQIDWRRDYAHGKTSAAKYFRLVPYLNFAAVGDHKFIWELNRHQHLVLLAQAHLLTGKVEYTREIFAQLESWLEQNPFQRGINWASALEVGFRALSWIWIWHFCGDVMPTPLRGRFLTALYQHGLHLYENLSVYFSPNTHLLGEAVALQAMGTLFPAYPGASEWQQRGAEVTERQLAFQVKPDGSHFEQSTYYHVYALDLFVFHYLMAARPSGMEAALIRMADYLHWLLGPARRIAYFGDDDGGRLFYPQGNRDEFGRATLATCGVLFGRAEWLGTREELAEQAGWWVGAEALSQASTTEVTRGARLFADAGAVFLQSADIYVQMDAGGFGWGSAGHSHADTLSVVAWYGGEPLLTDPGTFTYLSDPVERNGFRGTAAHNTITIDGQDQAEAAGPFRWNHKPYVHLNVFVPSDCGGFVDAICEYNGFQHRRRVQLQGPELLVLDEVTGSPGEHVVEQVWNLGTAAGKVHFAFSDTAEEAMREVSAAYGVKTPAPALIVKRRGSLPLALAMRMNADTRVEISVAEARRIFDNEVGN